MPDTADTPPPHPLNLAEDTSTDTGDDSLLPTKPDSKEAWQQHLASLPAKDLLQLLNEDKARANRLLAGFRPSGDALKNPRVSGRIIEEAMKQPKFADALLAIAPRVAPPPVTAPKTPPATPAREVENLKKEVQTLRDALDKRRATIQTKEMEIRELKAALTRTEHERDMLVRQQQQTETSQHSAETEIERLRHQLRRAEEREKQAREQGEKREKPSLETPSTVVRPAPLPTVAPPVPLLEAAERLVRRGRYAAVVELCREALNSEAARESNAGRGKVHALYANALYGQGEIPAGEEQSRAALNALLDGGEIVAAADVAVRFLAEARTIKKTDADPLRRLAALTQRSGQTSAVAALFHQLRLRSRTGYQRLVELIGKAGKTLLPSGQDVTTQLGPDQAILLPTFNAYPVTPRRIVHAVDAGETEFIAQVRRGLSALRTSDAAGTRRADALLEAVVSLEPVAVEPLLRATTHPVIVDASNIARFNPDPLAFAPPTRTIHLRWMRDFLLRSGFFPIVMIADANLVHHVDDRAAYQSLVAQEIVREVPAGTSADDEILREARLRRATVVTNDTFSDQDFSLEVARLGFHIAGGSVGLMPR